MNSLTVESINRSLIELLPKSFDETFQEEGNFAFARFFDFDLIENLCRERKLDIPGWKVYGVTSPEQATDPLITGDKAVEYREDKNSNVLVLLDNFSTIQGMDGVYSSSLEIMEGKFFESANKFLLGRMSRSVRAVAKKSVARARRLGNQNTISRWQELEFYSSIVAEPSSIGGELVKLGLWPVKTELQLTEKDIDNSARMVELLLLTTGAGKSPAVRVSGLSLKDCSEDLESDLERFVRKSLSKDWKKSLTEISSDESLWLGNIRPGLFEVDHIELLQLVKWRERPTSRPPKWSGLNADDSHPELLKVSFDTLSESKRGNRSKLEVRWKAIPEGLKKGAAEYNVSVLAGDDVLAEQTVIHSGRDPQKCKFTDDDFAEFDEGAKFEARIEVRVLGSEDLDPVETEEFLLTIGKESQEPVDTGSGKTVNSILEGLVSLDKELFAESIRNENPNITNDKRGFLVYKAGNKSYRIKTSTLLTKVENDWFERSGEIGRWSITVTQDGAQYGALQFEPFSEEYCSLNWQRIVDATRSLSELVSSRRSFCSFVFHQDNVVDDYLKAWSAALEDCVPMLANSFTLEVKELSGRTLGLVVMPMHPLRVAWQYAFDMLITHARFEENVSAKQLEKLFEYITGSYYPILLPGLTSKTSFVFGDMLGFFCPVLISPTDAEPKASLALLSKALTGSGNFQERAGYGLSTSYFLGREFERYLDLHPNFHNIQINAIKSGDGKTMVAALGRTLSQASEETDIRVNREIGYTLRFFSDPKSVSVAGAYLTSVTERRRTGAGSISKGEEWILSSYNVNSSSPLPRLKWAKCDYRKIETPANLSVTFDTFSTDVVVRPIDEAQAKSMPLEMYGLVPPVKREFSFSAGAKWSMYLAQNIDGDKHPHSRVLTDRLLRLHIHINRAVKDNLSEQALDSAPVLETEISDSNETLLRRLHQTSDWVISVDRNGGIEYFDSPKDNKTAYEAYVIDCVPERPALGTMQLVTSTAHLDELSALLDEPLVEMGLSSSPRNCQFLLEHLKAVSGRLAMKLANTGQQPGELVTLAALYANCLTAVDQKDVWYDLREGFFVPLDDIPELMQSSRSSEIHEGPALRADLIYVSVPKKKGANLEVSFVECKFRRYLRSSRAIELLEKIDQQLSSTARYWEREYFDNKLAETLISVNRHNLGRILQFYADKAKRHHLTDSVYKRIQKELEKFIGQGSKYSVSRGADRGFVFCPEYTSAEPERIVYGGESDIFLFGPYQMPDIQNRVPVILSVPPSTASEPPAIESAPDSDVDAEVNNESMETPPVDSSERESNDSVKAKPDAKKKGLTDSPPIRYSLLLGNTFSSDKPALWTPSVSGNPHLMIVGRPGMGKTTTLLGIVKQVFAQGGHPIVFSYHEDFDERIAPIVGGDSISFVDFTGLGFNPLNVKNDSNRHEYLDNASNLRDIFSAVFPDLGDLQLEKLRDAIKSSYLEVGWNHTGNEDRTIPQFQRFYDLLAEKEKASSGLMARLSELNDYGFFRTSGDHRSVLYNKGVTIIRLHQTSNESLQRAFASFVLYNIYQEMFVRGTQSTLTNVLVFDEAHKAAKLKLLGTMAKECRKYGISLIVASQTLKDFQSDLFAAISNYLFLQLTETDSKMGAKLISNAAITNRLADRMKTLEPRRGYFFTEGYNRPELLELANVL